MYGSGDAMISGSGVDFAQNLIKLYTKSMGNWAAWIIVPASFAAMFSTTLTCLDAYPRSISATQGILSGRDKGHVASSSEQNRLLIWIVLHSLAAIAALLIARLGGITVKDFVFGAMTGSFLTAPIFAWMAMDTLNSHLVPKKYQYGVQMKTLCWLGLAFLVGFSLLFIANSFFGLGVATRA